MKNIGYQFSKKHEGYYILCYNKYPYFDEFFANKLEVSIDEFQQVMIMWFNAEILERANGNFGIHFKDLVMMNRAIIFIESHLAMMKKVIELNMENNKVV